MPGVLFWMVHHMICQCSKRTSAYALRSTAILTIAKDYEIRLSRFSDHSRVSLISYPDMTFECTLLYSILYHPNRAGSGRHAGELMDSEDVQAKFHDAKQFLDGRQELI